MLTFNLDVIQMAESRGVQASMTLMIVDPPSASERSSYQKRSTGSFSLRDKTTWPEGETKPWEENLIILPPSVVCRLNIRKKTFRALMYHFHQFLDLWKKHKLMIQFQGFIYGIGSREIYTWSCFPRKGSVARELFPDFWFVLTQHGFARV